MFCCVLFFGFADFIHEVFGEFGVCFVAHFQRFRREQVLFQISVRARPVLHSRYRQASDLLLDGGEPGFCIDGLIRLRGFSGVEKESAAFRAS